jgi:GntR family transcriptional regulator
MIKFVLDPKAGVPYYRQIIDQIKFGIASVTSRPGKSFRLSAPWPSNWQST